MMSHSEDIANIEAQLKKSLDDILALYKETYVNFSDAEIELFGHEGLLRVLGENCKDIEDTRPGKASFTGRLDYDTVIKPYMPCGFPDTKERFVQLTTLFYNHMKDITTDFFEKLDPMEMRKYERRDHLAYADNMTTFLRKVIDEQFSNKLDEMKAHQMGLNKAATVIQTAFRKSEKREQDEWVTL